MFEDKHYQHLTSEFSDLDVFIRMIKMSKKRAQLLHTFQTLFDNGFHIAQNLVDDYRNKVASNKNHATIDIGLRLGGFLSEIGFYNDSAVVLKIVEELCKECEQNPSTWRRMLDCYHK